MPPLPESPLSRAGCGRAAPGFAAAPCRAEPHPEPPLRPRLAFTDSLVRPGGLGVEILDQRVPCRQAVGDAVPERLRPASLEILDADALLLDPGVIAEVEDLAPGLIRQLHHVVSCNRGQAGAKYFA